MGQQTIQFNITAENPREAGVSVVGAFTDERLDITERYFEVQSGILIAD
jgi:hypothetical protein